MQASVDILNRSILKGILLVGLTALTACASRPTSIPSPTAGPTLGEQTLPPSWTPVNTPTIVPTRTKTSTPTVTATSSIADLCTQFLMVTAPKASAAIEANGTALFAWKGVPENVPMVLSVTLHGGVAGLRADVPVPGDGILAIPMVRLPEEGRRYDWSAYLNHPALGKICQHNGTFLRLSQAF